MLERVYMYVLASSEPGAPNSGWGWGVATLPEFWKGGVEYLSTPLILRGFFF